MASDFSLLRTRFGLLKERYVRVELQSKQTLDNLRIVLAPQADVSPSASITGEE